MRLTFSKIANDANISCYEFDKVLWLIGSGRFYKNPNFYDEYQKPVRVIRAEVYFPIFSLNYFHNEAFRPLISPF